MFPQYINHHPHYLISSLSNTSANMVYDNTKLIPKNDQQTQQEEKTYPITTPVNNNNTNNTNNNNNNITTSTSNCILTPKPRKLVCLSNESSFGTFNFSELFNNLITVNNNNNNNNNNSSQLNCNNTEKIEDIYSRVPFINESASTSNNNSDLCDEAETEIRGIFFNQFIKCQTRDQNEEDISSTSPFSDSCFYAIQRKLSAAPTTCKSPYFFSAPPRVKNPLPQNFCNDS